MERTNPGIILFHKGQDVTKKVYRSEIGMGSILMGTENIVIVKHSLSSSFSARAVAKEAYIYIFEIIGEDRRVEERRGDIVRD